MAVPERGVVGEFLNLPRNAVMAGADAPLGDFDRLEIQSGGARAVVIIGPTTVASR